jgi:hypothetical protein
VTDLLVDFSDNILTITLRTILSRPTWNTAAFNGPVFTSLGPFGVATARVDAATTMAASTIPNFHPARLTSRSVGMG